MALEVRKKKVKKYGKIKFCVSVYLYLQIV